MGHVKITKYYCDIFEFEDRWIMTKITDRKMMTDHLKLKELFIIS